MDDYRYYKDDWDLEHRMDWTKTAYSELNTESSDDEYGMNTIINF